MSDRPTKLPPLNALRAFWAVMRHGSFRAAAQELLVSPQAVSQQIRLLEQTLAVPLFDRSARVIQPTEQAILLSHFVQAGFDEFAEGVRRVGNTPARSRININVSPWFATRHLVERLERFRERMPDADIRLTTMVDLPDFTSDDVDVSIQWGFGNWPGLDAVRLVDDPKVICCVPELAARIAVPADLVQQTLLHPILTHDLWTRVLRHLDLGRAPVAGNIQFADAATMRRATLSGIGIGLLSRMDAVEDLAAGRLSAPLGLDALTDMPAEDVPGFYLVLPRAHRRVRVIAGFCDWLLSETWQTPSLKPA